MGAPDYSAGQASWLLHPTGNEDADLGFFLFQHYLFDTDFYSIKGWNCLVGCDIQALHS